VCDKIEERQSLQHNPKNYNDSTYLANKALYNEKYNILTSHESYTQSNSIEVNNHSQWSAATGIY